MVANLAKPTPDRPALMTHDGMETFAFPFSISVNNGSILPNTNQTLSRFSMSSDMPYTGY
jgi:hypothetical protein